MSGGFSAVMYDKGKLHAIYDEANETRRKCLQALEMAEAAHKRFDTQLHEIVELRTEVVRLQAVVDSQSDRIEKLATSLKTTQDWIKEKLGTKKDRAGVDSDTETTAIKR